MFNFKSRNNLTFAHVRISSTVTELTSTV